MTDTPTEKIQKYKLVAEDFLEHDIRVAIFDINGEYYFADIILVGEETLSIDCFSPRSKVGKHHLRWTMVDKLTEYKEKGK